MTDELGETEALAAEYALGILDPGARAEVQQRLATDVELARLVDLWQQRLAPLAAAIPPVEPPPAAWLGIAQALVAETTPAPAMQRVRVRRRGLMYSVTFWRGWALGASALAALLALAVLGSTLRPPLTPAARYVAVLDRGDASPALIVTVDPAARRMTIRPLAATAVEDRALQLWLVAGGTAPPKSLGLLDPAQATTLALPQRLEADVRPSAALAISLEPPGGSPTGLPTGPVIYQGALLDLSG